MKALRDHYLRADARSLGLFRVAFGLVLVCDLFGRWRWLRDFYSNEGVLPNHNHLFNLRETGQVWSFLHAFSSPGENAFAFACILLVYALFFVGWATRVFHVLALVCLVSLTGRNILLENAGNYAGVFVFKVDTLEEAKRNVRETIELYLETLVARGLPVPEDVEPNSFKLKVGVSVPGREHVFAS